MNETLDELMVFGPTRLGEVAQRHHVDFDAIQALLDELEYPSDPSLTHEPSPKLVQRAQEQHRAHRARVAELTSALEGRAAEVAQLQERLESEQALVRKMSADFSAARIGIVKEYGELHESLALMVRYIEDQAADCDGIADNQWVGYQAAKALLERASVKQPSWEYARLEIQSLLSRAEQAEAKIARLESAIADHVIDEATK